MFERFTAQSRTVVVRAQEELLRLGHGEIGTEHLLLGLIAAAPPADLLGAAFRDAGVMVEAARPLVAQMRAQVAARLTHVPFSERAKAGFEEAVRAALELGGREVWPAHLFLGMTVDPRSGAVALLGLLRADVSALRASAEAIGRDEAALEAGAPATRVGPGPGLRDLLADRLRMAIALRRFGRHDDSCPQTPCICGFDEALAQAVRVLEGPSA